MQEPYQEIFAKYIILHQVNWNKLVLTDKESVKLSNLRLIYQHHDYNPSSIMKMVEYGKTFASINNQVRVAREDIIKQEMAAASQADQAQVEEM